jgi:hypothetical protein
LRALKRRFVSLLALPAAGWIALGLGGSPPATAQIPEGWEIRIIAKPEIPYLHGRPDINNRGQIVYHRRPLPHLNLSEIILYDRGRNIPLTDDDLGDAFATINNLGHVAWQRDFDPNQGTLHLAVMVWREGTTKILAEEPDPVGPPDINDNGWIVWHDAATNTSLNDQVWLYDGQRIRQITSSIYYNQSPRINQSNQIAWNQFDYRPDPWLGSIMAYLRGFPELISPFAPTKALGGINDHGMMTWGSAFGGVDFWDGKQTMNVVTGNTRSYDINNRGDILIVRWDAPNNNSMLWMYREGALIQITDGVFGGNIGRLNERGEAAFEMGRPPYLGIALLTHPRFDADADFDADVDLRDYARFQNCFGAVYDGVEDNCRFTDANNDQSIGLPDAARLTAYFTGPE